MKKYISLFSAALFALTLIAGAPTSGFAQQPAKQPDAALGAAAKTRVLEALVKELNARYVFPETARKMEADLRARMKNGEYEAIAGGREFARRLTDDLRAIGRDKHLNVFFSAEPLPAGDSSGKPSADEQRAEEFMMRINNYGFAKVENLPGNIGYLDLRGFVYPQYGAETLTAAMNFVANSDALIIDLRQNMGGEPEMVALLCSYFFDAPVHLNDIYNRETGKTQEFWTQKTVAGKKFLGKSVYILTSSRTFSAAEEFTNDLKVLKRATVVGETTLGGANPGVMIRLSEHFQVYMPNERAVNPVTKTNWEGTGVEPDVKVAKEQSLATAYILALNNSLEKADNEMMKDALKALIEKAQKELDEPKKSADAK